jgi:hypothetical protein
MAEQTKFGKALDKLPGIVGTGVGIARSIGSAFKRKPNVRAWSQAKREERRRLKATGLSGSDLRQALRAWSANNPRPQGSEPYNPMALGTSNQTNANAQADIGTFAPLPNNLGTRTAGSGLGFSPFWLLLAIPFIFPTQFKKLTKIKY